jgi:two-component system NtrC family sensor kinase
VNKLKSLKIGPLLEDEEFIRFEDLLIAPLTDRRDQVNLLLVFESCPGDFYDEIADVIKEIKDVFKVVSLQMNAISKSINLKNANLVSRISHDINSLIALIPKEYTKDEALIIRIKYSEILSREIMYYLREMTIEESKVPVEDLLNGIIAGIQIPSNVKFSKKYAKDFDLLTVDVELIDRALSAIIENATFSTKIDGGSIDIKVDLRKNISPFMEFDWLEIVVSDTGPGIAKEFINDVQNPMFTTWKDQGHVGLGLSIANNIIQAHNGFLKIESKPAQETRAIIHLPMR